MQKIDPKEASKLPTHPLFKDLPKELKDPKCFMPIERKLTRIMYSDHKHATVKGFVKCKRCQAKFMKKREELKKLGFKGVEQYQGWKRIMTIIHNEKDFVIG